MTIFIHCGFHKTASTYLQRLLRDNAGVLAPHLAVFNRIELATHAARLACLDFCRGTAGPDRVRAELARLADAAARAAGTRPVLITDEAFFGPHPGQDGEIRLYPRAPDVARMMIAAFAPAAVEVLLYRRDEEAWLKSVYNQSVKQDRYTRSYAGFLAETGAPVDLGSVCARISDAVGPQRLRVFRLEADREHWFGTGAALLAHVGLPDAVLRGLNRPKSVNESLDPAFLGMMRFLNHMPLPGRGQVWARRMVTGLQKRQRRS